VLQVEQRRHINYSESTFLSRAWIFILVMALTGPGFAVAGPVVTCRGETATIVGTEGKDSPLEGTAGDDVIAGLGGDDWIRAGKGDDVICGGDGLDRAYGSDGDDWVGGGGDADSVWGEAGDDVVLGMGGPDFVVGDLSDELESRTDNDVLRGGGGDDDLNDRDGNSDKGWDWYSFTDQLVGGPGNDSLDSRYGEDVISSGDGLDDCLITPRMSHESCDELQYYITPESSDPPNASTPKCFGRIPTVVGTSQSDIIQGSRDPDATDVIVALDGNDFVNGDQSHFEIPHPGGGDDLICTGSGKDEVNNGGGDDKVDAGAGNDDIEDDHGDDLVLGSLGNDQIGDAWENSDGGDDIFRGGLDKDRIVAYDGDDQLHGGRNGDKLVAFDHYEVGDNGGPDLIRGGPGPDRMNSTGCAGDRRPVLDYVRGNRGRDFALVDRKDASHVRTVEDVRIYKKGCF
jgi:Ca2+-binding RTX toxin-like protein